MRTEQSLRELNREIEKDIEHGRTDPEWWVGRRRVHPARHVLTPLVRTSEAEATARQFFADVARDGELMARRANILWTWARQRRLMSVAHGFGEVRSA